MKTRSTSFDAQNEANKKSAILFNRYCFPARITCHLLGVFLCRQRKSNRQLASKNDELAKMFSQLKRNAVEADPLRENGIAGRAYSGYSA